MPITLCPACLSPSMELDSLTQRALVCSRCRTLVIVGGTFRKVAANCARSKRCPLRNACPETCQSWKRVKTKNDWTDADLFAGEE